MTIPLLGGNASAGTFDAASGEFLSAKAQRIADLINQFDDTLFLEVIPERLRTAFDSKPYRIVQRHPEYEEYAVMHLREDELDHRVLATLFNARDAVDKNDVVRQMENMEAAQEALRLKTWGDSLAEAREKATFLIRTPYHTVRMDGKKFHL
jgi:hypothetical protein